MPAALGLEEEDGSKPIYLRAWQSVGNFIFCWASWTFQPTCIPADSPFYSAYPTFPFLQAISHVNS
jgi:hypothetical protein